MYCFYFNSVLNTRGHANKLVKNKCGLDCRKFSFSFRVIYVWNFSSNNLVYCSIVKQLLIG